MFKKAILGAFAAVGFGSMANAQVNLQTFYDFGKDRQYLTTTFEMFKPDKFGDTFFFIDHYYNPFNKNFSQKDADGNRLGGAVNGSYFEIERGLNFWQETSLKDLRAHIEYDGSTWGAAMACVGAKYFFHSADYSKTFTIELMYDFHIGIGKADVPLKVTGVWGLNNLFGVEGLTFKGFADFWGNNNTWGDETTKFSFLTEPQRWCNVGSFFDNHLDIGGEIELSYNFAGNKGFMCNPCAGLRWVF